MNVENASSEQTSLAKNTSARKVGRKKDSSRNPEILDAALSVLAEKGFEGLTVELVAAKAQAGKGTLYRRWPSKNDLILDAIGYMKSRMVDIESLPDTGTLRQDLLALFKPEPQEVVDQKQRIMAAIINMLAKHHELSETVNELMVEPWARVHKILMERARSRGEVSADADIETISRIAPTMAAFRSLVLRKPFDKEFLLSMVDGVILPALGINR